MDEVLRLASIQEILLHSSMGVVVRWQFVGLSPSPKMHIQGTSKTDQS